MAMSPVLLAGAGLFVGAAATVFTAPPGFEARQVLLLSPRTPTPPYTAASSAAFQRTLEQRLPTLPGIGAVCFASSPPFSSDEGQGPAEEVRLLGQVEGTGLRASVNVVSPNFFDTLGISIVRGRSFRAGEAPVKGSVQSIAVSETMARALWPGADPLGQTVEDAGGGLLEVVGVSRDLKSQRFGALDGPSFYRLRDPRTYGGSIVARFNGDAAPAQLAVRNLIREMDREMLPRVATLQSMMDEGGAPFWKMARIVILLRAVAIVLAVIGIYDGICRHVRPDLAGASRRPVTGPTPGLEFYLAGYRPRSQGNANQGGSVGLS